jgi:MFS family permease
MSRFISGTRQSSGLLFVILKVDFLNASVSVERTDKLLDSVYKTLFGLGMGFLFVCTSVISAQLFRRRRSLANGITAAGSGFGGLIYSLITGAMLEKVGLGWTFRALAIICLTTIAIASNLLRDRDKAIGSRH